MTETLQSIAESVRRGARSAEESVRAALDGVARGNEAVHAFLNVEPDRAMAKARALDASSEKGRLPLAGVPVALKDNLSTAWGTTTCGSKALANFRAQYNAHVVDRLEAAGAIVIGKTNLDEYAMGSTTEHSAFGPTRNPWDRSRVAGGSSGGSAAAVAAGLVPGALGSDTGGSVRLPASFCGVVGLKPTYGRVSRFGLVAYGSSLDQIGTLTHDARDAALLLSAIAGHDPRDSTSVPRDVPDYAALLERPIKGLRLGIADEYFGEGLSASVRQAVTAAIAAMQAAGAQTVPVHLPHMKYGVACYYIIATAEASSNLARFDGVHYGHRTAKPADALDVYASSRGESLGAEVKRRIMLGTYVLSSGYYDAYYLKALKVRTLIKRDFEAAFQSCDLIASPVAPTTAFPIGEKSQDPLAMYLADIYTISANLAGLCAMSLPCGFDVSGLPIGLQLMGPAFSEEVLLAAAHQYQSLTDHHRRRPEPSHG